MTEEEENFDFDEEFEDDEFQKDRRDLTPKQKIDELDNSEKNIFGDSYWPYEIYQKTSNKMDGKEVIMSALDREGKEDVYAGRYLREMIEGHYFRPKTSTWLGYYEDPVRGFRECGVDHNALFRHTAIFGTTGYGKSTLLKNMLLQWAYADYGFCFIDPTGDDVLDLLQTLPEHRMDDVVWVEPGDRDRDKIIGFNYLETYHDKDEKGFEKEVEEIVSDFVSLLESSMSSWGATMDTAARIATQQLVKSENNYTVLDMYKLFADEEEREYLYEKNHDEQQMSLSLERLKNFETEDLEPLMKRIDKWTSTKVNREIVAHRESSINIPEAVENGKIILVRTSSIPNDDIKALVSASIIRRIWTTMQARENVPKDERDPFFLALDEFDIIEQAEMDFGKMLSKGRKYKLGVCIANQFMGQLSDQAQKDIRSNCNNLFTFGIGTNRKEAKKLSTPFNVREKQIFDLDYFELIGRFQVGETRTEAIKVKTPPPYPPRRKEEKGEEIIDKSLQKYGVEPLGDDWSDDEIGIIAQDKIQGSGVDEEEHEVADGERITHKQLLESVFAAQSRNPQDIGDNKVWAKSEDVFKEVEKYCDVGYKSYLSNALVENTSDEEVEDKLVGEETYFHVTEKGEEIIFEQDTGIAATGGGTVHRQMLKKSHKAMTKLGYKVKLPRQVGSKQPDGIAIPPRDPVEESQGTDDVQKIVQEFQDQYPRAWELFEDSELHLEAETSMSKPTQAIENLAKAMREGRKCLFVVNEPKEDENIAKRAEYGERILKDPPFVSKIDERGNRKFYTRREQLEVSTGGRALMKVSAGNKQAKPSKWWGNSEGEITLKHPETDDIIAVFDDIAELLNPAVSKFKYYYEDDPKKNAIVVKNQDGKEIAQYDEEKEMKKDGYHPIKRPAIPEKMFPEGELPPDDQWSFLIIPDDTRDEGPYIYNDGELEELFKDSTDNTDSGDSDENLSQAAMEGYMENEGKPPKFKDNRDKEDEGEETEEDEDVEDILKWPEK